ncbi:uncharacterized protein TNCV_1479711 [Trichonephila clavipes]|nr:uncharacterized protein TNCV_1479711 [Trichonephila clavipes]
MLTFGLRRSSCAAAEQFYSDASLEAEDRRAPSNSKNWQWMTEGDFSAQQSTLAPHGGSPSRQTIDGCVCNGLMSTEPGKLIDIKLSFQMNHASICGTIMTAFVLDAMPANAALQSALSNDIVA